MSTFAIVVRLDQYVTYHVEAKDIDEAMDKFSSYSEDVAEQYIEIIRDELEEIKELP